MWDCDGLLRRVMREAATLKIPFSDRIDPHVKVNDRAVSRFGCCKYRDGYYTIEVAKRVAEGPEEACRTVLAHELLHTCYGCRNHGKRWKSYAERMERAYGYPIRRTSTDEELGVEQARPSRYLLRCESCGMELRRYRASALTKNPERYRCKCGGKIVLITGESPENQRGQT